MEKNYKQLIEMSTRESDIHYGTLLDCYLDGDYDKFEEIVSKTRYDNESLLYDVFSCLCVGLSKPEFQYKKLGLIDGVNGFNFDGNTIRLNFNGRNIIVQKLSQYYKLRNKDNTFNIFGKLKSPSKIVSGYTYGYDDKIFELFHWIEVEQNGKYYVIDVSGNLIIDKDSFYLLKHPKVINSVDNEQIKNDKDYLDSLSWIKQFKDMYLLFRNEIVNDIEKNKQIFRN